jgi:hypothetical protein
MRFSRIVLLTIGAALSMNAFAAVNVELIQQKIVAQKAQWTAGRTWVSDLPEAQVRRMMGNREVVKDNLDYSDAYSKSATYESVDWRNMNGINWLAPVMNQGNCGSCVAFATVGTLEASVSIANKTPWLNPRFSPQHLFACGGAKCEQGWYPDSGAAFVKSKGIVDNACSPYTMGSDGKDVACKQFCNDQSSRTYKAADTFKPSGLFTSNSVQKVKDALKKGPLVTSLTVYEDFLTYTGGIYKSVSSKSVGGHAVSIVGYNDAERYWIVRNSWGEDWGEKGFIRVSWDDKSGVGSSTIGFTITPHDTVSVMSPAENDYVSGEVMVKTQSSRSGDFDVKLMKDGKEISTTRSGSAINTNGLEDGKYEMLAVSTTDVTVKSFTRGFTVMNGHPSMHISFTSADDTNYGGPVTDRHLFNITVDSTPVMPQTLDIMLTDTNGKLVTKRTTDVVLKSMKLGFRFNSVPSGDYIIFFRANMPSGGKMMSVDSDKMRVTIKN